MKVINTVESIREVLGEPNTLASKKIYTYLNEQMKAFIQFSPMVLISTVDSDGYPTISPKGEQAGFVRVTEDNKLLIPELRGNKLAFSLSNLVNQNKIALFFMVPGTSETLRVHGKCRLLVSDEICQSLASDSHNALLVLEIEVDNAYFHCGKAFLRSRLWLPDTWQEKMNISLGKEISQNVGENDDYANDLDKAIKGRYVSDI